MSTRQKVWMMVLVLLTFSSLAEAGRLGIGLNYPGLNLRYGSEKSALEVKIQFGEDSNVYGLRGYKISKGSKLNFTPYLGIEMDLVSSDFLKGGLGIGSFVGIEKFVSKNLAINFDAGIYYLSLDSSLGGIKDVGLVLNSGLNWYFGGGEKK